MAEEEVVRPSWCPPWLTWFWRCGGCLSEDTWWMSNRCFAPVLDHRLNSKPLHLWYCDSHHICCQVRRPLLSWLQETVGSFLVGVWCLVTTHSSQYVLKLGSWADYTEGFIKKCVFHKRNDSSDRKWFFSSSYYHLKMNNSKQWFSVLMQLMFLFTAAATLRSQLTPGQMSRKTTPTYYPAFSLSGLSWSSDRNHQHSVQRSHRAPLNLKTNGQRYLRAVSCEN